MAIPALLASVPAVAQGVQGISQAIKAKKLSKLKRPAYERPEEAKEMEDIARARAAQTKLPGQERMESQIARGAADVSEAARKASDPYAFIAATSEAQGQAGRTKAELGQAAAEASDQRKRELMGTLQQQAQYSDIEFDINKMEPYRRSKAAESALRGSSIENIAGGLSGLAGVASASLLNKKDTTDKKVVPTISGANDPAISSQTESHETSNFSSSEIKNLEGQLAIAEREGNTNQIMQLQEQLRKIRGY